MVLEIKCPFSAKHIDPSSLTSSTCAFFDKYWLFKPQAPLLHADTWSLAGCFVTYSFGRQ